MIKVIRIEENIFEENERIATEVRKILKEKNILSFNIMGSPGSGKTEFIEKTLSLLNNEIRFGIVEGDIEGKIDAERIEKYNVPIIQINTGGSCHLDANMLKRAILNLPLDEIDIIFVENVGNLVCPAEFEIGTEKNIIIYSITEGDDKVIKYPLIFRVSQICILNKIDLLQYVEFNMEKFENNLKNISPSTFLIKLSAKSGENFQIWIDYLKKLKREKN
ncbi:MAG: hydrogenase nickel incorporation protein HypB [Candidatus Omnitrophica bacterium]|nr:hydrogenase nickel incorporation protein HypB [Candidatus Omnitrophota bacterium]